MRKSVLVSRLVDRYCRETSADRKRPTTWTSATRCQQCWIARLGSDWLSRDEKSLDVGVQGPALLGCYERIDGGPDRRKEARSIGKLVTSANDSMVISCPNPSDWSSRKRPKLRAMMPGQIIEREPRARTNTIAATVSWANWLLAVSIHSPFLACSLPKNASSVGSTVRMISPAETELATEKKTY